MDDESNALLLQGLISTNDSLLRSNFDLGKALLFVLDECDELINRHYGGELPCSTEVADRWQEVRALRAQLDPDYIS